MFLSLSEIDSNLKQLREKRANINSLIHYYEHMKQQAIAEHYRGQYTVKNTYPLDKPVVRY